MPTSRTSGRLASSWRATTRRCASTSPGAARSSRPSSPASRSRAPCRRCCTTATCCATAARSTTSRSTVMREMPGIGQVIGVDLGARRRRPIEHAEVPGTWALLLDRLRPRAKRRYRFPSLLAYLMNVTILYSSSRSQRSAQAHRRLPQPAAGARRHAGLEPLRQHRRNRATRTRKKCWANCRREARGPARPTAANRRRTSRHPTPHASSGHRGSGFAGPVVAPP